MNQDKTKDVSINQIVKEYLEKKEVSYAYLLNGEWGSGKTFYCKNVLKRELEKESEWRVLHISLFGKTTIDQISFGITLILLELIKKEINDVSFEELIDAFTGLVTNKYVAFLVKVIKKMSGDLSKKLKKIQKNKKNILLVFDDLERCSEDALMDLLGQINTKYIENGYHVLFVANENQIKNNQYQERKEKLVRITIDFQQEMEEVLISIIKSSSFNKTPIEELLNIDEIRFKEFIQRFKSITNLRTWQFAFDNFNTVVSKTKIEIKHKYIYSLLCLVLLTTYEMEKHPELMLESSSISSIDDKNEISIKSDIQQQFNVDILGTIQYGRDFKLEYPNSEYTFAIFQSLIDLVKNAKFDSNQFISEFNEVFPIGNKFELAFINTAKYISQNKEELIKTIETILEGVSTDKYSVGKILGIRNYFEMLEKEGYLLLSDFGDYREIINEAIITRFQSHKEEFQLQNREQLKLNFTDNKLKTTIKNLFAVVDSEDEERVKIAFIHDLMNMGNYTTNNMPRSLRSKVFENIVAYNLCNTIFQLDSRAIYALILYLYQISNTDNCGEIDSYYSEMKYIDIVKEYLEKNLRSKVKPTKLDLDIKQLCSEMKKAIIKLKETAYGPKKTDTGALNTGQVKIPR